MSGTALVEQELNLTLHRMCMQHDSGMTAAQCVCALLWQSRGLPRQPWAMFVLQGRNGAVCVIALAERGALFDPGPCMYMEKLAVGPAVPPGSVSLENSTADNIKVSWGRVLGSSGSSRSRSMSDHQM